MIKHWNQTLLRDFFFARWNQIVDHRADPLFQERTTYLTVFSAETADVCQLKGCCFKSFLLQLLSLPQQILILQWSQPPRHQEALTYIQMTPEVLELKFLSKNFKKEKNSWSISIPETPPEAGGRRLHSPVCSPTSTQVELWTCAASQQMYSMKEAVFITCTCIDRKNRVWH